MGDKEEDDEMPEFIDSDEDDFVEPPDGYVVNLQDAARKGSYLLEINDMADVAVGQQWNVDVCPKQERIMVRELGPIISCEHLAHNHNHGCEIAIVRIPDSVAVEASEKAEALERTRPRVASFSTMV